jgi:hypothetical protein
MGALSIVAPRLWLAAVFSPVSIGVGVGIGIGVKRNNIGFGHEKLDVYRAAIECNVTISAGAVLPSEGIRCPVRLLHWAS